MTTPETKAPKAPPTELRIQTPDGEMVFRRPESAALRFDVLSLDRPSHRIGALLGVCWREKRRPSVRLKGDLGVYGAAVFDELANRGWSGDDLADVAIAVLPLVLSDRAQADTAEVEHARGFTAPTEGGG